MSAKEIAKLPATFGGVLPLPMTADLVVLTDNVPGVNAPIRLSRSTYVELFLREITSWDDPTIAKDNSGSKLPDLPMIVVTRAGSARDDLGFSSPVAAAQTRWGVNWTCSPGQPREARAAQSSCSSATTRL